jgi:chromosome segregation protein
MHLSALRLRGFKSFPEQVELRFFPGVAVIVGRSSSGASNLPDSLQRVMSVSKRRARRSAGWTRRGSPCI